ncbi:MAG: hypothetical protein GY816_09570 [Cytophagales bacterium]|nr:hypothetical protein [Cytophagales bacterium]
MTLQDLQKRNDHFQRKAAALVDLLPGGGLLDVTTALIRGARLIDKYLAKLVQSTDEEQFAQAMRLIEEEIDESVFILDRIDKKNRKYKLAVLDNFLKEGYDLLSVYSLSCDHIISKRINQKEEKF